MTKTTPRDRQKLIKLVLKNMHSSAASLAADWPVCKAPPSDDTASTGYSGAVVKTTTMSRPRRAQCTGNVGGYSFCDEYITVITGLLFHVSYFQVDPWSNTVTFL